MNKPLKTIFSGTTSLSCSKILIASIAFSSSAFAATNTAILPEVTVEAKRANETGYKVEDSSISKITTPLLDTPKSITVIPRAELDDKGVTTMRDALRTVPGISIAAGEAGAQGDNLTIRGFTARSDFFLDGTRDFGSYYRDPFNLENIEVLKGPDSILFGRGSTGGIINQESKTAKLETFNNASLTLGTDSTKRVTVDTNQQLGQNTALRVNLMAHENEVAGRDVAENERYGIATSLAFGINTEDRLTLNLFHQQEDDTPDYGIPWLFNHPAPVDRDNYYGFKTNNFLQTNATIGTAKYEHDFNDDMSLSTKVRYAVYDRDAQITEPQLNGFAIGTPLTAMNVTRNQIAAKSRETYFGNQTDLTNKFETFGLKNTVVSGVEISRETSAPIRRTFTGVPTANLLDPNEDQTFAGTSTVSSSVEAAANTIAIYTLDTIALNEKWDLIGGLRFDRVESTYVQSAGASASFDRIDDLPSWRAGLVYKPLPNGSVYVSASNSYNPSIEGLALAANNAKLDPEESRAYEVGTKWDLLNKKLNTTLALFHNEKNNARVPDPNNASLNVLDGEQKVEGVEVEVTGNLTDAWKLSGGYTYMESEVVKSTRAFEQGQPLANVPRHTLSLWSTYELPCKLELGGGMNYVAERIASATVDTTTHLVKTAPGYFTFDAMAKYPLNQHIDLQLNVYNLTDQYYYDQLYPSHIVPGAGRTALLATNFKF
jgi:catecholate siderophore receptor